MTEDNDMTMPAVQEAPPQARAIAKAEEARAVQEVQAAMIIAKKFPRNEVDAERRILTACKRLGLAEKAIYRYPRGGETVTGPSIRLLETIAQGWGNLQFGIKEVERLDKESVVEAFCFDMETNTRCSKIFTVPHVIDTKKGQRELKDARDVYEHIANHGARRMRACIMGVIPGDVLERAVQACKTTIAKGDGKPIVDRIKAMAVAFGELGITRELLEKRLGHTLEQTNGDEIADLQCIYNALKGGDGRRSDYFDFAVQPEGGKAAELKDRLAQGKGTKKPDKAEPAQQPAEPGSFAAFNESLPVGGDK